jgi:hypothetical protein
LATGSAFDGADAVFVAPVECPLPDAFWQHQFSRDPHVALRQNGAANDLFDVDRII